MEDTQFLVLALLLVASAVFSGSEVAFFSLSQVQIRHLETTGDGASKWALRLLRRPQRLLNSLLVGNTLVNVAISAYLTTLALRRFGEDGLKLAIPAATLAILLISEILPKSLAVSFALPAARRVALPLELVLRMLSPLTWLVDRISAGLMRLFGLRSSDGGARRRPTHSDFRAALEEIEEEGGMSRIERRLTQNILAFSRTTAEEVMTPRVDIVAAPAGASRESLWDLVVQAKHSRIPLYEKTLDGIIGYLPAREFLLDPRQRTANLIRPLHIVPEKAPIDRVFHDLRKGRWRMAIVVNEYGETTGLLTIEDLIEQIVGELYDEYEETEEEILEVAPGVFEALGRTSLQDLGERIGVDLPQDQAVTLNGLLCSLHGGFPRTGAVIRWGDVRFEVLEIAHHRVIRARVSRDDAGEGEP